MKSITLKKLLSKVWNILIFKCNLKYFSVSHIQFFDKLHMPHPPFLFCSSVFFCCFNLNNAAFYIHLKHCIACAFMMHTLSLPCCVFQPAFVCAWSKYFCLFQTFCLLFIWLDCTISVCVHLTKSTLFSTFRLKREKRCKNK